MASSEATETKLIITSLLTSNPLRSNVRQLCRDFMDTVGYGIPARSMGFVSVEDYLRSIPDTVRIYGSGPNAEVEGVIKQNSAHINLMVTKQKKPRVPSSKRRRIRYVPGGYRDYPTGFSKPFHTHKYNYESHHQSQSQSPIPLETVSRKETTQQFEVEHTEERLFIAPQPKLEQNGEIFISPQPKFEQEEERLFIATQPKVEQEEEKLFIATQPKFEQKEERLFVATQLEAEAVKQVISPPAESSDDTSSLSTLDEKSVCDTLSVDNLKTVDPVCESTTKALTYEDTSNTNVPLKLQNNLKNLIVQYPNGIWCTKLPTEYRKQYNRGLHFEMYNYRSLIQMIADLPEIFHFTQPVSDDFLVFDKNIPLPTLTIKENENMNVENVASTYILDEVQLDWTSGAALIPSDVVRMSEQISRFFPSNVSVGDLLEIEVGEIYDLSKFWITMAFGDLEKLMSDLQTFFNSNHTKYLMPEKLLQEGLFCVSLYCNEYHRCVILNLLPNVSGAIKVLFIDYGTVENVWSNEIWFLPKRFSEIPCQAVRARLSNIYPLREYGIWSADTIARFQQLITNRVMVGEVTRVDEKDHVIEFYLADITNEKNIFYVNDVLVKEGLARYTGQEREKSLMDFECVPFSQYMHLYPDFYEIECGLAPTVQEMKYIIAQKLPFHHYMPQYFDIYYREDVCYIRSQHEKYNKKKLKEALKEYTEEDQFDFSLFPGPLVSEIKDIYSENIKTKQCDKKGEDGENNPTNSVRQYSCNKKRISELLNGCSSQSKTDSDSNSICDSSQNLQSPSSVSLDSPDITPLNDSLKQLNLNNSDGSILNNFTARKSTNPFFNSDLLNDTNPFHATNPFLRDPEGAVNTSEVFQLLNKSTEEKLPDQIVNNLNDSSSSCSCKSNKQVNVEKSIVNLSKRNPFKPQNNEVQSVETPQRVRTPPGFSSLTAPTRMAFNTNSNNSVTNPHYQIRQQLLNISLFALNQPMNNAYNGTPLMYQNSPQLHFNQPGWNQGNPPNFGNFNNFNNPNFNHYNFRGANPNYPNFNNPNFNHFNFRNPNSNYPNFNNEILRNLNPHSNFSNPYFNNPNGK